MAQEATRIHIQNQDNDNYSSELISVNTGDVDPSTFDDVLDTAATTEETPLKVNSNT